MLCVVAMLEFARLNRKKDADAQEEAVEDKSEFAEMGDKSPCSGTQPTTGAERPMQ